MSVIHRARLQGKVGGAHRDVLRGSTVARKVGECIDGVARSKVPDARRYGLYHAGNLVSRNRRNPRRAIGILIGLVPCQLGPGNAGCVHSHQRIARTGYRPRRILVDKLLGTSARVQSNRFHRMAFIMAVSQTPPR
jgi:hypothetical protein